MAITIKTDSNNGDGSLSSYDSYGATYVGGGYNAGGYNTNNYNASGTIHVDDSYYYTKPKKGGLDQDLIDKISNISKWAIYGFMALGILFILGGAIGGMEAFASMLPLMELIATIEGLVIIFDIIFSFIFVKRSVALLLCGFFLAGLYPIMRGWILEGEIDKIAVILEIATFFAGIFLMCAL